MSNAEYSYINADGYVGVSVDGIAARLIRALDKNKLTLSTAESCTGGLMGKLITDVPGASAVYVGGAITYTNEAKIKMLGVSKDTVEKHTEVSFETAEEMAMGAIRVFSSNVSVSATGFAGPGGGTDTDPVGTVYVGVVYEGACTVYRLSFDKSRSRSDIRHGVAAFAFDAVWHRILDSQESAFVENR